MLKAQMRRKGKPRKPASGTCEIVAAGPHGRAKILVRPSLPQLRDQHSTQKHCLVDRMESIFIEGAGVVGNFRAPSIRSRQKTQSTGERITIRATSRRQPFSGTAKFRNQPERIRCHARREPGDQSPHLAIRQAIEKKVRDDKVVITASRSELANICPCRG